MMSLSVIAGNREPTGTARSSHLLSPACGFQLLAAAGRQVRPTATAAAATARIATAAQSTVTALASRRRSRSRLALDAPSRGKAAGIAGRKATGIGNAPSLHGNLRTAEAVCCASCADADILRELDAFFRPSVKDRLTSGRALAQVFNAAHVPAREKAPSSSRSANRLRDLPIRARRYRCGASLPPRW